MAPPSPLWASLSVPCSFRVLFSAAEVCELWHTYLNVVSALWNCPSVQSHVWNLRLITSHESKPRQPETRQIEMNGACQSLETNLRNFTAGNTYVCLCCAYKACKIVASVFCVWVSACNMLKVTFACVPPPPLRWGLSVWSIPALWVQRGEPAVLSGLWAVQTLVQQLQPAEEGQGDLQHLHPARSPAGGTQLLCSS